MFVMGHWWWWCFDHFYNLLYISDLRFWHFDFFFLIVEKILIIIIISLLVINIRNINFLLIFR